MNKYLKYALRTLAVITGVFILLYSITFIYVSVNKKKIITQVKQQVSQKLSGDVNIGDVELSFFSSFPAISVLLQKVSVRDTLYSQHKHPFLTADRVYARISVFNLIAQKNALTGVRIEDGNLYLYTDTSGYTNSYLMKGKQPAKPSTGNKSMELDDIKLKNFHITLDDRQKNKLLDFDMNRFTCDISDDDTLTRFKTKNDVLIKSLAFNLKKGSYAANKRFKGNFTLYYNKPRKHLYFNNINIRLNDYSYNLSGGFDLHDNPTFTLLVATKNLPLEEGKSLLPAAVAKAVSIVMIDKPIDVKASIGGPLKGVDPLVKVAWTSQGGNRVVTPFFTLTNCSFTGGYTNELIPGLPRKDPNSRIFINDLSANWEGLSLRSKNLYIDNLTEPKINMDLHSDFSLAAFNNVFQSRSIEFKEGRGLLNVYYSGPLIKNSSTNTSIRGILKIQDGTIIYLPRNIPLKNCNGAVEFKKTDVAVRNLSCNVLGNSIIMNGSINNMLSLLGNDPGKIALDWHVYSPSLDLAGVSVLLQKRKKIVSSYAKSNKLGKTARQIDQMLEESNVSLNLKTDQLLFKKFKASNVDASIELVQDNWNLNHVKLNTAGGLMQIKGYLKEKNEFVQQAALKVLVANTDVSKIMYAFNDFGQDGVSFKNLEGVLSSNVDITMDIDRNLSASPSNMNGNIYFTLKNGALIDYEPIKKLQTFLFKNRDFENIRFAELKDHFEVKGKDIIMNRMEIQSTVLTLFVKGIFSMEPGKTDVSIQVPLSNLKKRDADYIPKNKGADEKAGASVYVRGRPGDDGNIKFKLDLFKKFRKDDSKKEEEEKKATKK